MKKEKKQKIYLGSALAALVAGLAIFTLLLYIEKKELSAYETVHVYCAAEKIEKGQIITGENCGRLIKCVELPANMVCAAALGEMEEEWVSACAIDAGSILTQSMVCPAEEIGPKENEVLVTFGAQELYQAAGGVLRAGDWIRILHMDKETGMVTTLIPKVAIVRAMDASGNRVENAAGKATLFSVYLKAESSEPFYEAIGNGSIRIVKLSR